MLAVLSPAKKLDFDPLPNVPSTDPELQKDANRLVTLARKLSVSDLQGLMQISEDLAKLNRERFKAFAKTGAPASAKQAMFAFAGDTYQGLDAAQFSADDITYAQDHLRILSGLYGVLRPLDRIQPYRLEMGSRLANTAGANLYAYWGTRLAKALDAAADGAPVVNLASSEYFKAANAKAMKTSVIDVAFKEERNGQLKMIGFFAKRARGAMARYIIQNKINSLSGLRDFDLDGYRFSAEGSGPTQLLFTRAAS